MKLLFLDVECTPNLATVWGIWQQNIGLNQLHETSRIMCYTAKWADKKSVIFDSEYGKTHKEMITRLHLLMSEADAIVHYNGNKFDIPVINREYLKYGMEPPKPYKNIDLLQVVKKKFRFVSNKLDHVSKELQLGQKVETGGHELWLKCMANDAEAWKLMEDYNKQDVVLLEKLYKKLLPWIENHPNHALYSDDVDTICTNCGSHSVIKRGLEHLKTHSYQRYQCKSCRTWMRGRFTELSKDKAKNVLTQVKD